MRPKRIIVSFLLLGPLTGCYTKRTPVREPIVGQPTPLPIRQTSGLMTQAIQARPAAMLPDSGAEEFLKTCLKDRGLPGLPRGAAGTLETTLKIETKPGQFPTPCSFRFIRTGDPNPYVYTVEQTDQSPGWRIIRAFQADLNGKILKQFPLE